MIILVIIIIEVGNRSCIAMDQRVSRAKRMPEIVLHRVVVVCLFVLPRHSPICNTNCGDKRVRAG